MAVVRSASRRTALRLVVGLVVAAALWSPVRPAAAQDSDERITGFKVDVTLAKDGSAKITDTITYDLGFSPNHGIELLIPTVVPWTGDVPGGGSIGARYERVTPISDVTASVTGDAADDVDVSQQGSDTRIRIGDPDREDVTGVHTYTISYRMAGVATAFGDHDEVPLNVIGTEWPVPITNASATVTAPGTVNDAVCFAGPYGSQQSCESVTHTETTATATQSSLAVGSGLTLAVALPKGVLDDPRDTMIVREQWSIGSAFRATWLTVSGAIVLLVAGLAGIGSLLWRNGRDRRYAGSVVDAAFGNQSGDEGPVPLFDKTVDTVEFVPPEGIRPGHMGTLWDEQANPLDVSAMIVDLAVRGWLRIDEIAPTSKGFFGIGGDAGDHQLVQLRDQLTDPNAAELWEAEKLLLASLFATGNVVRMSDLRQHFSDKLRLIQSRLYDDAVAAGWFPARPDRVRARWHVRGILLFVLGCGLVFVVARWTHYGLLALSVPILGLVLLATGRYFPRRTAKGTALLGRVRGFKELFDAGEGERQRFAEQHNLFMQYLPYAIVFGCADKWALVFADLGLTPEEMGMGVWYTSPYGYNPLTFAFAMNSFTTTTAGSLAMAAPSSTGGSSFGGGGFSGGGFGGGGGGSW